MQDVCTYCTTGMVVTLRKGVLVRWVLGGLEVGGEGEALGFVGWWVMFLLEMRGIVYTRCRGSVVGLLLELLIRGWLVVVVVVISGCFGSVQQSRVLFGAWFVTRCFTRSLLLVMVGTSSG